MLSDDEATGLLFEQDTEKRMKMIDGLSEEDAKDLLKRLTSVVLGGYRVNL